MERIESLINQVKVINNKYDSIKKLNGENFNIFSILKIERREVQAHSYFIYCHWDENRCSWSRESIVWLLRRYSNDGKEASKKSVNKSEFWFALKEKLEPTTFEISYLVNDNSEDIKDGTIDYKVIEEERSHRNHNFFGLNFKYSVDIYTIKCDIYQYDSDEYMTMDYRI